MTLPPEAGFSPSAEKGKEGELRSELNFEVTSNKGSEVFGLCYLNLLPNSSGQVDFVKHVNGRIPPINEVYIEARYLK